MIKIPPKIKPYILLSIGLFLTACGTLDSKTIQLNVGDSKQRVLEVMGTPGDRQVRGINEAWQYCISGASYGANDHKIIWMKSGLVTGISSYKSNSFGCTGGMREVRWESSPDAVLELRSR
jgi:hypothetical protein